MSTLAGIVVPLSIAIFAQVDASSFTDLKVFFHEQNEIDNLRIKKRSSLGNLWKRVSGCQGVPSGFLAAIINTIITCSLAFVSENIE